MTKINVWMRWWIISAGLLLAANTPVQSNIRFEDLTVVRSVTEGEWLQLKLALLGLKLSYLDYRIDIHLEGGAITFNFRLSTPLAEHLEESGEGETGRMLAYHAEGISDQIVTLLQDEFPELWPRFDLSEDVFGVFWKPGDDFDSRPVELAYWRQQHLYFR